MSDQGRLYPVTRCGPGTPIGSERHLDCDDRDDDESDCLQRKDRARMVQIEHNQASSTRYLLRVVIVVTSVTIVPRSSRSDSSVCWARVADCPAEPTSYEGREPRPSVSDDECEVVARL